MEPTKKPLKFRKKPVVIEAMKFTGDNWQDIQKWMYKYGNMFKTCKVDHDGNVIGIIIKTLEGEYTACINDYIVRGVNDEFYPCKPDIFVKTYELYKDV